MRILALDLGRRRIGVAISDDSQTLAVPLEVIERDSRMSLSNVVERLGRVVRQYAVESIVVGHPIGFGLEPGPQARYVMGQARRIAEQLQMPLTLWDERLSTVRAKRLLAERGKSQPRRRQPVDALAAAVILQEYLDARHTESPGPIGHMGTATGGGLDDQT